MIFVTFLLRPMKLRFVVTKKDVSHLTSKVDVARLALVTELSRLKCTSCQMFTYLARFVMAHVITVKRLKFITKTKISLKFLI